MLRKTIIAFTLAALIAGCTEDEPSTATSAEASTTTTAGGTATSTGTAAPTTAPGDGSIVSDFAGQDWFVGTVPNAGVEADSTLEPIVIGMINQENSPVGSFPEVRAAAQAAVNWINAELGGVNGRPIEFKTCITSFSVEQSQACAQQLVQDGAVAVISGIDITANGSLPILEQNGIPMISAVPTTLAELRSSHVVSFSGGTTGADVAFVAHAAENGAKRIAIAYGQFESFEVPAVDYGAKVAESLGLETTLIPFSMATTDFLPVVQSAIDSGADAITIAAADSACVPIIMTLHDLGYTGTVYMVGSCAAVEILAQIPDDIQADVVFNREGPSATTNEREMYFDVADRYADEPAGGAGTVSFRAVMNLWAVLTAIGPDITPAAITERFASSVDQPSFWRHPYTCDGKQVPGMPALCSPQQTLFSMPDDLVDHAVPVTDDWIDVPAFVADLPG